MKYLILITTVASYFVMPRPTLAAELPTHVFVSEVNWAGSAESNADEWLELTNPLEEAIDISNWSIEGAATSGGRLVIPAGATIASHSMYLIANYDAAHSTTSTEPNHVTTELALSNSGLGLVLRDGSGAEIDRAGDGGSPPAGFSGSGGGGFGSMIWSVTGWISASVSNGFDPEVVQFGTPGVLDVELDVVEVTDVTEETKETKDVEEVLQELVESDVTEVIENVTETTDETENTTSSVTSVPFDSSVSFIATPSFTFHTLLINEVASAPTEGPEWVEIVNPQTAAIDLTGWRIQEAGGTSIELSGTIEPQGFAVGFFTSRLNNSGDTVKLIDPSGNLIDEMSYGDGQAFVARTSDGAFVETTAATRGAANNITFPVVEVKEIKSKTPVTPKIETKEKMNTEPRATTLRLAELLPNPDGEDTTLEFVVLENFGDTLVDLTDWVLTDGATDYKMNGELAAGLRLVLPRPVTHIALNNDEDTLELIAPDGRTIETLSYEKSIEGASYIRSSTGFDWHHEDHPDESCPVSESEDANNSEVVVAGTPTAATSSAKQKTKSSAAASTTLEGVVIAPPGIFSSQTMYMDGMQLYQYQGDFPELVVGDLVRATGVLSTAYGEPRLKLAGAEAIQTLGSTNVEPVELTMLELEEAVGELVRVSGMVTERGTNRVLLEDESGSVTVVLKEGTEIPNSLFSVGSRYAITGVVSSYNGELRLLPRFETDIEEELTTNATTNDDTAAAVSSEPSLPWGSILLLASMGALGALALRQRRRLTIPQHT